MPPQVDQTSVKKGSNRPTPNLLPLGEFCRRWPSDAPVLHWLLWMESSATDRHSYAGARNINHDLPSKPTAEPDTVAMIASTFTITRGCSLLRLQFILFHHRGHHRLLALTSPSKVSEAIEPQACWFPCKRETHRTAWRQAMSACLEASF